MTPALHSPPMAGELRPMLAPRVSSPITSLRVARSDLSSSYPMWDTWAALADGRCLWLLLKQFDGDRYAKTDVATRGRREAELYDRVLGGASLGTATSYGAVGSPDADVSYLLLEHVDGVRLESALDDGRLTAVARWLAALHAFVAAHPERVAAVAGVLEAHDDTFYWALAERAARKLAKLSAALSDRLRRATGRYGRCVALLMDDPPTLVHGSFRPQDILIRPDGRVCPIDWERAALGCRFYDLVYLTDLLDAPRRDALVRTYLEACAGHGLDVPEPDRVRRLVDGCLLHKTLHRLRKWGSQTDVSPVQLLDRFERLIAQF